MKTRTIRNIPADLAQALEAERRRRDLGSLEGEIHHLLARHARRSGVEGFRVHTALLCALTADRPQTDSVALLREDRCR